VKTTTLTTSAWASATRGAARNGGSSSTAARRTPVQRIDTERYAVETEDGFVSYGGVASLSATDDAVDLSFTDPATADLRLPDAHLHIALELTAAERELIEIGLSRIFAGTDQSARPDPLTLPHARGVSFGTQARRRRKPRQRLAVFTVQRVLNANVVEVTPARRGGVERLPLQWLSRMLHLEPERLPGAVYSCVVTPDAAGESETEFRLLSTTAPREQDGGG
jgi:hypothetical protein